MKKLIFIIFGLLALMTTACSSDDIEPLMPTEEVQSRAGIGTLPPNPMLLKNWEICNTIKILGSQGVEISVATPWNKVNNSYIDGTFATDVKKTDGWVMLFHTFNNLTTDPDLNYMCLYNRFSGMMKFFYYSHTEDEGTLTMWDVRSNTSTPQALFANYGYFSNALNGNTNFSNFSLMLENASIEGSTLRSGWNGFEFKVTEYQRQIATSVIAFAAYNTVFSEYNFDGQTTSTTTGTITTVNGSTNILQDNVVTDAVLASVGDEAEKYAQNIAKKLPKKNFWDLPITKILNSITSGNVAGAIADGFGFLFKSLIKPNTPTVSEVSLQTNGTLKMAGNGLTKKLSCVKPLSIDLNGLITYNSASTSSPNISTLANSSKKNVYLGVWNLKNKPTVNYCRYSKIVNYEQLPDKDTRFFDVNGIVYLPEMSISDVNIEFNPDIQPYIKSYSVKTAMIDVTGGNRTLPSNKNINQFYINRSNFIVNESNVDIYGINENQYQNFKGFVFEIPDGVNINNDTQLYYDWGTNATGNRAVAVIVTWTVEFEGNTQTFTESRVYDVNYKYNYVPLHEAVVNTPPETYLLQTSNFTPYLKLDPIPDEKM